MAIINTTNIIDNSIFLKANIEKNMVGDNYYVQNVQYQRDYKWDFLADRVDIEEENKKQIDYTEDSPVYTAIETVLTSVKDEKGKALSSDYAKVIFKDLSHNCFLGKRYRFCYDFLKNTEMTEEEKYYKSSIWITINDNKTKIGSDSVIRRCNSNIGMQGSPSFEYNNITEYHYEPCILENDLKNMNIYYNQSMNVPNAEWYVIMQLNYFTDFIKLDDVLLLGGVNTIDKSNNAFYKVKAISKACGDNTFFDNNSSNIENIPLITLALEKVAVDLDSDFEKRVPAKAPLYLVKKENNYESYIFNILAEGETERNSDLYKISLGTTKNFSARLRKGDGSLVESVVTIITDLPDVLNSNFYYSITQEGNDFAVLNKKTCNKSNLNIQASTVNPETNETMTDNIIVKLGGFY